MARVAGSRLRASGSRVARFYTPHGGSLHYSAWQPHGWFFFALERLLERWTDQLIFVSDYERSAYFSKIGEPRIPWQLVYNGIRESEFEPVAPEQNAADFLYIGMMRRLKGPDRFIDAFKRAEELTGRTLTGVMIGDGEDYDLCRNMIERHRLSDRIAIRAAMPAREAFALGKVVVVPSRAESMPYIVLEAVAAGKSVIASKVGGIPEILGKNPPALVSAEDIEPLASAMARAILDPSALADAMPDMAAFRQRFSARIMASRIAEIYLSSLARPVATSGAPLPIY